MSFPTRAIVSNDKCKCGHEQWRHSQDLVCHCGDYIRDHPIDGCGGGVPMEEPEELPYSCRARGCGCGSYVEQPKDTSFAEAIATRGQAVVKCEFHRNEGKSGFCSCLW